MLTYLLLTSELKGYIESPAYYFSSRDTATTYDLDILMQTRVWRRYNIEKVLHGDTEYPEIPVELGTTITGSVQKGFFVNRTGDDQLVTLAGMNHSYFDLTETDSLGRFSFMPFDAPDTTTCIVQASSRGVM
jgi:hypothetical protein